MHPTPAAPPRLLALDTSTEVMAVATLGPGGLHTRVEPGGVHASERLMPAISTLMSAAGMALGDLEAIAFARGPGAFTGLRTACAVAQGLALGLDRPTLPLDSLLLVADDALLAAAPDEAHASGAHAVFASDDVGVAMDARMGQVYAARYRRVGDAWETLAPPALCDPQEVLLHWGGVPAVQAGSGLALLEPGLLSQAARRMPVERDRAAALMRLALAAWRGGVRVDPADALPLYLRDKVAQTTAERAQRAQEPA